MRSPVVFVLGFLLCLFSVLALAVADEVPTAAALNAQGKALLAKADFDGALASFLAAARAEPKNKAFVKDALVLKRVVAQRKALVQPKRHPKWEGIAMSLHAFYLSKGLHAEAIQLGTRGVAVLKNSPAENRLVEALLEASRDEAALKQLTSKVAWERDARHGIFHGIALARQKRFTEAAAHAKAVRLVEDADPRLLRDAARLEALLGHESQAAALLVKAFQKTPVAKLTAFKTSARAQQDFARILAGPLMIQAFTTASKQKPTGCSGGSDCGSCPSRGKCGGK